MAEIELIRTTERERLRAMVEADMDVANQLHADDFQLINPVGMAFSKEVYLGDVASGFVDYLIWEPETEIDVRLNGEMAVIRYQALMDIVVGGGEKETLHLWHTDTYEKRDGRWQVVWSQATETVQ